MFHLHQTLCRPRGPFQSACWVHYNQHHHHHHHLHHRSSRRPVILFLKCLLFSHLSRFIHVQVRPSFHPTVRVVWCISLTGRCVALLIAVSDGWLAVWKHQSSASQCTYTHVRCGRSTRVEHVARFVFKRPKNSLYFFFLTYLLTYLQSVSHNKWRKNPNEIWFQHQVAYVYLQLE